VRPQPSQAPHAVPNVTADQPMASVLIAVLLYDGPLLCGINVPMERLKNGKYNCKNTQQFKTTFKDNITAKTRKVILRGNFMTMCCQSNVTFFYVCC